MNSIFDYARNKIKKKYQSNGSYDPKDMEYELYKIDCYEKSSKEGLINAIKFRLKAFRHNLNDNEDSLFSLTTYAIAFALLYFILRVRIYPLNISLLESFQLFFEYVVIITVYFIYRLIKHKIIKNRLYYIVWALFFVLSIPYIPTLLGYQTTQIGDFYEAREYKEKYYVIMSKKPENVSNRKQYTLPAEIERRWDYSYTTNVTEDYFSQEHGGHEIYVPNYHINRLYFPNGGCLVFNHDSSEPEDTDIELNKETEVIDYHDNTYYVTLTDRKVSE